MTKGQSMGWTLNGPGWLLALLAVCILLLPPAARADFRQPSAPVTLAGPTVITLSASGQGEKTYTVTTPAGILAPLTLVVTNGPGSGVSPVAEGTIWLDDIQVAGPNDFRAGRMDFRRVIDVAPGTHTLKVVLRGPARSGIRFTVLGRKLLSVPVSADPSPLDLEEKATAQVAVTLAPPPDRAGTLQAASLDPLGASVPARIRFSAGQSRVPVPVKGGRAGATEIAFTHNQVTLTLPVNVVAAGARVASLSPALSSLGAGAQGTLTVALQAARRTSTRVTIESSPAGIVSHPATVTVPAGALRADFPIQGLAPGSGQLTASVAGTQASSQFHVSHPPAGVASLLPAASRIAEGASESLTLALTQNVDADTPVSLSASPEGIVGIPDGVTVRAGSDQSQVPVHGRMPGTAMIRAELNGGVAEAAVQVTSPPAALAALEPPRIELYSGARGELTVMLATAQPEAVSVSLAAEPARVVSVPRAVVVPAGEIRASFHAHGRSSEQVRVIATLNGDSKVATVDVVSRRFALVSLSPDPLSLQEGAPGSLLLKANAAQPRARVVALTSAPEGIVQHPASVTLPAGQTAIDIPVTALVEGSATLTASADGGSVGVRVIVMPPPPKVAGIEPAAASTPKGRPISLAVRLDRVTNAPRTVLLSSSAPGVAVVPSSVVVPVGASAASFAVAAAREGQARITASLDDGETAAEVTVTPAEVEVIALSPIEHTAYVGDRVPYNAQATYSDASQRDITQEAQWSSSDEAVAGVGTTGIVDAWAAGTTQVGAALDGASQTTPLTVLTPSPLSLASHKTTLKVGESATITVVSAEPADALGLHVSFSGGGTGGLTLPAGVVIPPGQTRAMFTVTGETIGHYSLIASAPRRASASRDFTIVSGLEITGLLPMLGEPGSVLEIQGNGFDPDAAKNAVVFFGNAAANVISASPTRLTLKVPVAAQTGAITLYTPSGTATSPVFTVIRRQDFALTVSPAAQTLLTGGQAIHSLSLSSLGVEPYTGLASLKVSGLPEGVTAKFSPPNLALNQPGSLILKAAANALTGAATLTVQASALISGAVQTREAQVEVNVLSGAGVTGVKGRFVTPEGQGIAGVRVNVDGNATVSDAAGNFMLTGLPAGKVDLRMDATPAHPLYPIWPNILELESGKLSQLVDWVISPPPADEAFTAIDNATQDQVITDARYPGVAVVLPAGVVITGWDGVKKTRLAVERIEASKLPVPMPPVPTREHYQLYFGTPMGGIPDQPIPVAVPNVTGLGPGEKTEIWYYDGSPMYGAGEWKIAGTASVSDDGQQVVTDPGQGIPRFCGVCGLFAAKCPPLPQGDPPPTCGASAGNPVELYTGYQKPNLGGLTCSGLVPLEVGLSYSPVDIYQGRSGLQGSFGEGWFSDHEITLASSNQVSGSKRLLLPGGANIDFAQQVDGGYRVANDPRLQGAVLTKNSGTWELRHKDGSLWRFGMADEIGVTAAFLTEIIDPRGNARKITRRADYKITRIGSDERAHVYSYGPNNFVEKITDPAGREMHFTYNAQKRIETATDADGGITRYTYVDDNEHPASPVCTQGTDGLRIKTIEYPGLATLTENHHGSSRRVLRQTSRLGETRFAYQVTGACITHVTTPDKTCTANCPQEDSWENFEAGWRYHGGQVVATRVIEASGRETLRRFNAQGIVLELHDPDGLQSQRLLDGHNRIVQDTDLLGRTVKTAYDAQGNVISRIDVLGRVTDTQYDPTWNRPTVITRHLDDGSPVTTQIQYHATHGQPSKFIDPENRATALAYTARGQLASLADPLGQPTRLGYNPAGDLIEVEDPLGNLTRLQTDDAGRTITLTTPRNHDWQQSWNGQSQQRVETDPTGGKIEHLYDQAGRLESTWDPNGHPVERHTHDPRGNRVSRTDALDQSDTHHYDSANRLIQTTTRKGDVITYAYDGQDRLTQITRPDGTTTYAYDAAGRLIQIEEGATRLHYAYDPADRLVREVQDTPHGYHSIDYQYDTLDRRISRKVNGGDETRYTWNKADQLTQIQYRNETTHYQYDAAGRLASKTLPGGIVQTYSYDAANRLTQIQYQHGTTLIDQLDLTYDADGNIVGKTLKNGSLKQDSALTAQYDAANRMTNITVNGKTYALSYDAHGNLTHKQNTADPTDSTTYTWDPRNRLTALTAPGLTATFQYDPLGRRIERTVNGDTTHYLYDGLQAIGEVRGGQSTALLTGLSIDEAIARYASSGRLTQLTDQLGSVIRQIDEAGQTQSQTAYSPYGEAATTGDDQQNSTEYTGRENDRTGLYFYQARYYDSMMKRFVSEDPIGVAGGINLYAYVKGNPISYIDPYGLWAWGDPLNQGSVDAVAGFGDSVSSIVTFGLYSSADARNSLGIGGVDQCSAAYTGGKYAGYAWGVGTMWAAGLNGGANSVFWSGAGNMQRATQLGRSLESTPIGAAMNYFGPKTPYWMWKAASATFAANAKGVATKFGAQSGNIWRTAEQPILNMRGIPVSVVP